MKKPVLFIAVLFSLAMSACKDKCEQTYTYRYQKPVFYTTTELRNSIASKPVQELKTPGKIYVKDNYLFINEIKKGIHVIDNSNPNAPRFISFLNIPGNTDIAVRGNVLYADSYVDFLAIDISDPKNMKVLSRTEDAFPSGSIDGTFWQYNKDSKVITDYVWETQTVTQTIECDGGGPMEYGTLDKAFTSASGVATAPSGNTTGTGGSMARFAIYDNYLYAVTNSDMQLFNIAKPEAPKKDTKITLGWGIETIFPYKDKLFVGTTTGLQILDNVNPSKPTLLSTLAHITSCDPVVVDDRYAYVTLRSGMTCARGSNQLDIVDIQDLKKPFVLKSYPMQNPHGLGIDNKTLFLCEGDFGLKVFDAKDVLTIDKNLLAHFKDMKSYDVIPLGGTLMMIGADGLYQYDYKDPKNLKLLSVIPVKK